jgi:cellobiose-specific phosphotransferase system component IIC
MELQLLKNVQAYKRRYWTFPSIAIERQVNTSCRWISFLLLFGKTAIGVRIYYAFAKNTEQRVQADICPYCGSDCKHEHDYGKYRST